jgi:Trk K+ transport system NAD-binding subunit
VQDLVEALRLYDLGLTVVVGDLPNPETYRKVRVDQAAMVASTASDEVNTNVTFTVREESQEVPVITTADAPTSVEILRNAGSSQVLHLAEMMGQSLARRIHAADAMAHVVGQVDALLIAKATTAGTPLIGKSLQESKFREVVGITILGVWERGKFETARPETLISPNTVLVLAGSQNQLNRYNELFYIYHVSDAPVVIIGRGRVGQATGSALTQRQINYRFVDQSPDCFGDPRNSVVGNAVDPGILEKAGIMESPAVVITTHDDDTNIYLTTYCRHLRPDIQIITRATLETNVHTLHRAGADFVMSFASMGANAIFNFLKRGNILMVTEGLDVFKVKIPHSLIGKTITESSIRPTTGCSIIAVNVDGDMNINPDPTMLLPADSESILIGTVGAEDQFLNLYTNN